MQILNLTKINYQIKETTSVNEFIYYIYWLRELSSFIVISFSKLNS